MCFTISSALDPTFDAYYNAGRVLFHLATDHVTSPCETLDPSVSAYRRALELEASRPASSASNVIDAKFNIAQALVVLGEMIEEGAADGTQASGSSAVRWATEAKGVFAEVERMQRVEMERVFVNGGGMEGADDGSGEEEGNESVQMGQAVEGTTVTPSLVTDTILESVSNDLSLFALSSEPSPGLVKDLMDALDRITALRALIPPAHRNPDQDLAIQLAQLNVASTCATLLPPSSPYALPPSSISATYESLLSSTPSPELFSSYADFLLESLSSPNPPPLHLLLETALKAYTTAHATLSDRLSPPRSIPAHVLPSLLSANLSSRAFIYLLLYHHHLPTSPHNANESLSAALSLAGQAIEACGAGVKLLPGVRLALSPRGVDARGDWRTTKALRDAVLVLVRVKIRASGEAGKEGLEALRSATARDARRDVTRFVEDVEGDAVWVASGEGVEAGWWRDFQMA